jgi:hypothetical protein
MIPIKNETVSADSGLLLKGERTISNIMHDNAELLKENQEVWKGLVTLRSWFKKAIKHDNSAILQIRCYGDKLLAEIAEEVKIRAHEGQRMEEESPAVAENSNGLKSAGYFEIFNEIGDLRKTLEKRGLFGSLESIPMAV